MYTNKAIVHILLPIVAAIIINAIIYSEKMSRQNKNNKLSKYLPPGYVIAVVWMIILGLLGYVHYLVYPSQQSVIIVMAILFCLAYPFLTNGLQQSKAGVYNVLSFIIALVVFISVYSKRKNAVYYVLPFLLWTFYVASITVLVNK
jgi:tryptophan-rich sensory protein